MEAGVKHFSLGELANIALGSPELTKDHLNVLQVVVTALMKKLGCEKETVRIAGYEAQCLKNLLDTSTDPPIHAVFSNNDNIMAKLNTNLVRLESRAQQVRQRLDEHYEDIRINNTSTEFYPQNWDRYSAPTEDLCYAPSEKNINFCEMLSNTTLIRGMRWRTTEPVLERMDAFDLEVDRMTEQLKDLSTRMIKSFEKLSLVKPLIGEVEKLRQTVNGGRQMTRDTLVEIEDMINCKVYRRNLIGLKIYVDVRFEKIDKHLKPFFRVKSSEPLTFGKTKDAAECLSCFSKLIKPTPILHLELNKKCKNKCQHPKKTLTLAERLDRIKVTSYNMTAMPSKTATFSIYKHDVKAATHQLESQKHYVQNYGIGRPSRSPHHTKNFEHIVTVVDLQPQISHKPSIRKYIPKGEDSKTSLSKQSDKPAPKKVRRTQDRINWKQRHIAQSDPASAATLSPQTSHISEDIFVLL